MSSIIIVLVEFSIIAVIFYTQMDKIIGFYTENEMIVDSLKSYLPLAIWELFFSGVSMAYESALQNTEQNKVVSKAYLLELITNVTIIVFLIKILDMGIVGVAFASLLTKIMKFLYMLFKYKLGYKISFDKLPTFILLLLKVSVPILIETFLWNASSTILMSKVGHLSITHVTIYSVFTSALYVLFVPAEAFTKVVKVYIGQLFGKSKKTYIKQEVKSLIFINQFVILFVLFVTTIYYFNIQYFYASFSAESIRTTYEVIPYILIYTALKGENELISNGVLHTGLDNTFKCFFEGIMVVCTYGLLLYFKESLFSVFVALIIIEFIRLIVFILRALSGKWLESRLLGMCK